MTRVKRIFLLLFALILFAVCGLVGLAYLYEDEIVAEFQESINEQLAAPVSVGTIDFSLLRDFPHASIVLHDVAVQDGLDTSKTLLAAQRLALEFGVIDLVQGQYNIDRISVSQGRYDMHRNAQDVVNYIFWKTSDAPRSEMSFEIRSLELSDIAYTYVDEMSDVSISSHVDKGSMSGRFSEQWMDMRVRLSGSKTDLLISQSDYLVQNGVELLGDIKVKDDASDILFVDCILTVGDIEIPFGGRVNKEERWNVDLALAGEADLHELFVELPKDQKGDLDRYALEGQAAYKMTIKGATTDGELPVVNMDFELAEGSMELADADTRLDAIAASGHYQRSTAGVDRVQLDRFDARLPQGQVAYTGLLRDFDHPRVKGRLRASTDLDDVLALVEQQSLTDPSGHIDLDITIDGRLPVNETIASSHMNQLDMQGSISLDDIAFTMISSGYRIEELNSDVRLERNKLLSDDLEVEVDGQSIEGQVTIDGFWPYALSETGVLRAKASLKSPSIDLLAWQYEQESGNGLAADFELVERVELDVIVELEELSRGSFIAEDVKARLRVDDKRISANDISLSTAKGQLSGAMAFEKRWGGKWHLDLETDLMAVDLPELFRQHEQFDQDFLLDSHLRGLADAHIALAMDYSPSLDLDMQSILCDADVTVHGGELIEHPAMIEMIAVLKEKHLLKAFVRADDLEDEMHHLEFETLSNRIHIAKGIIEIPEMHIDNNSVDIQIAGSHSFGQEIDYRLDFDLRDILLKSNHPDFYVEDDGLGHVLHIRMTGTADEPLIALDKEAAKSNRREALAQAKTDIRALTRGEVKSTAGQEQSDTRSAVKVQIVKEGDVEEASSPDKSNVSPMDDKKKKKRWSILSSGEDEEDEVLDDDEDDF